MGLTSKAFVLLCVVLAVGAPVAALLLWPRVGGPRLARGAQRLALIVACQVTAVAVLAVAANDSFYFYTSWSELLGTGGTPAAANGVLSSRTGEAQRVLHGFRSHPGVAGGLVLDHTLVGARTGLRASALVYLPPQYADPRYAHTRFPVVTVMQGYPGNPRLWLTRLPLPQDMAQEVRAGRARPFVAVLVQETVVPPRDTECADVPHGPQVETFLAKEVRADVIRAFRVRSDRAGWAMMGDSTGGFCAVKMAMRHPDLYGSAVSVSGYFRALLDGTTGALYGGSARLRDLNSPLWRLQHLPAPPIAALVTGSRQERTYPQTAAFLRLVRPPMQVSSIIAPTGGHNTRAWRAVLPQVIDWLGQRFG